MAQILTIMLPYRAKLSTINYPRRLNNNFWRLNKRPRKTKMTMMTKNMRVKMLTLNNLRKMTSKMPMHRTIQMYNKRRSKPKKSFLRSQLNKKLSKRHTKWLMERPLGETLLPLYSRIQKRRQPLLRPPLASIFHMIRKLKSITKRPYTKSQRSQNQMNSSHWPRRSKKLKKKL